MHFEDRQPCRLLSGGEVYLSQESHHETSRLQAAHYNRIADDYAVHYGDKYSQEYRNRFINKHLFEGIELKGLKVLEAMCGSGETTAYLLEKGADVTGVDVSESEIDKFKDRWPDANGVCSSIYHTGFEDESWDCVVVVGGLHHLHPHLSDAVREMHRILKKGGYFCFAEPHQGSLSDSVRRVWYRHDDLFADNEEAIDVSGLHEEFKGQFSDQKEVYCGNLGYLFVLNSMVFRVPIRLKKLYSPLMLGIEGLIERFQGKLLSCIAIGQWRKR
jgi:SAM-dependent methyltransferase